MGFNNGYDSGYSDALEDVRSGKVAGLGPESSGTPAASPTFMTNTGVRYVPVGDSYRVGYAAPQSVTASVSGSDFDLQVPSGMPAGSAMNVTVSFEQVYYEGEETWYDSQSATVGIYRVTVNGDAVSGLPEAFQDESLGYNHLVLWFDGTNWIALAYDEYMP